MGRRAAVVVLGAITLLGASACGGSNYEYHNNSAESVYFKVPRDWTTFDILEKEQEGRISGDAQGIDLIWHVGFDGAELPALSNLSVVAAGSVVGSVQIYAATRSQSDVMSTAALRQQFLGFDPLKEPAQPDPNIEVVGVAELANPAGAHGFRSVVNFNVAPAGTATQWVTRDLTYLLDDVRGRVYVLDVRCMSACYKSHLSEINAIVQSFTVDTE